MKEQQDRRTLAQVLKSDGTNIAYFFTPLICTHLLALQIKPYLTDSPRGPWEIIWHSFLVTTSLFFHVLLYATEFCLKIKSTYMPSLCQATLAREQIII